MPSDKDIEIHERLACVEVILAGHIEREEEQVGKVLAKLDALEDELSRYRGIVGGILLMVTAIVTFVKLFGTGILEYFSK